MIFEIYCFIYISYTSQTTEYYFYVQINLKLFLFYLFFFNSFHLKHLYTQQETKTYTIKNKIK